MKLQLATAGDVADLVAMRNAVQETLSEQFGQGPWSGRWTENGALAEMKRADVYIARRRGRLVASLALTTRKPWAIDTSYFSPSRRPLYLVGMAVASGWQRKGIGRLCVAESCRIARNREADAIRLDAFDAAAGAGEFYRKCGFREVGRVVYRKAPLIYFEMMLC